MKKTLLILSSLISTVGFSQLLPNPLDAKGFINSFSGENAMAYTSVEPGVSLTAEESGLKIDISATASMSASAQFEPFDGPTKAPVNISDNKVVFAKLKGKVGDIIRIDLKNSSSFTFIDGYSLKQPLVCEEYRWYRFDFSNLTNDMSDIRQISISHSPDVAEEATFFIDSLLVGTTGVSPKLPINLEKVVWRADFSNTDYKYANGGNTISSVGNELTANIVAEAEPFEGIGLLMNVGSKEITLDISRNPFVTINVSGNVGDTIRLNLKSGLKSSPVFIDGFSLNKKIASVGYQTYSFDFTGLEGSGDFKKIVAIEMQINPTSKGATSFKINSLVIGDQNANGCTVETPLSLQKTIFTAKNSLHVYPNPVKNGRLNFQTTQTNISLFDLLGNEKMASLKADFLNIEDTLQEGVYIVKTDSGVSRIVVE